MERLKEIFLEDEIELIYGKGLIKKDRVQGCFPVYGSNGVVDSHIEAIFNGPGIIIGRKGTVGSIEYSDYDFWAIDTTYVLRLKSKKDDLKFWYYFIKTLNLDKMNSHSAVPGLNREAVYKIRVNILANIEERRKVSYILSTLDEKIEINNQINKKIEEMAQAIFKHWFVDFEFPNENGEPYKSSGGEMVESELGMIPKGWEVSDIETLTELIIDYRGKTPKKLGKDWSPMGIIALSAKSVKNGKLVNLDQAKRVDKELYSLWMKDELEYGDILLTSEAPLGELYFIASDEKYCLSQRLFAIRANKNYISSEILYMYLRTPDVMKDIENRATGTTVTGIRQSELRKVRVLKPTKAIQDQFQKFITTVLNKISLNEKENFRLINVRDALLPKLMSGEIRVPIESEEEIS